MSITLTIWQIVFWTLWTLIVGFAGFCLGVIVVTQR